jgi:hypothetical protein
MTTIPTETIEQAVAAFAWTHPAEVVAPTYETAEIPALGLRAVRELSRDGSTRELRIFHDASGAMVSVYRGARGGWRVRTVKTARGEGFTTVWTLNVDIIESNREHGIRYAPKQAREYGARFLAKLANHNVAKAA